MQAPLLGSPPQWLPGNGRSPGGVGDANRRVQPRNLDFDLGTFSSLSSAAASEDDRTARAIFSLVDLHGFGSASKLDLITAVQRHSSVCDFVLPGVDGSALMRDTDSFDAIDGVFQAIGGGKHRISCSEFVAYYHKVNGDKTPKTQTISRIFSSIDREGRGSVTKLEVIRAIERDPEVHELLLPGMEAGSVMESPRRFERVDALFTEIAGGKSRATGADFERFFRPTSGPTPRRMRVREIFDQIDCDGVGSFSKLQFFAAMQQCAEVDEFVLPGASSAEIMSNDWSFDAIDSVFDAIADGRKRVTYAEFEKYFRKTALVNPRPRGVPDRTSTRIFIIGPGFGQQINPRQGQMIEQAGFQVHFCNCIPNPEQPNFPVGPYIGNIVAELEWFKPDIVACASKGGVYMVGLWQTGAWRGPSLLINAHPCCMHLPQGVPVVIAHGANDEVYPAGRQELESLMATGTPKMCFLYYTANSGQISPGMFTREGDRHNMESLLLRDCLPRLIDSLRSPEGPELHIIRTWRERLSDDRLTAERWLGYTPERLHRFWSTPRQTDGSRPHQTLFHVSPESEEYQRVLACFKASPREAPAYLLYPPEEWARVKVVRIERIENPAQEEGCTRPYYHSVRRSFEDQEVDFEPGVHTVWGFHGADAEAVDSIVSNPVNGFQPLASGSRNSAVWGAGTYFARDAQYVAGSHFCGPPAPDGTRQMLMCLLITGMPCLGDPEQRGVLPFRQRPHRYNSSVDSLSSPEVHIVQNPGAAVPAYLVTFA